MAVRHEKSEGAPQEQADAPPRQLRVFINYRHDDCGGWAHRLYDRLAQRFGPENVFLDDVTLRPGMQWLEEILGAIKTRAARGVFLSLIGSRWMAIMQERQQGSFVRPDEDYVRVEIEQALKWRIPVVPVLVGDNVPLSRQGLPRSLQAIAMTQAEQLRPGRFDEDVEHLFRRLEELDTDRATVLPPVPPGDPTERTSKVPHQIGPRALSHSHGVAPPPDPEHYGSVVQLMVEEGNVVPVLGSRLNGRESGALPDTEQLAANLATRFNVEAAVPNLAEVAQYVYVTRGRPDLYRTLKQILTADCEPGSVHRFLARFPRMLEELRLEKRYQMIVSTNFDATLERAFDDEHEPYDLTMYMASGPDKGKFVHFPYMGRPEPITVPNTYGKLPIGDYGELERTMIVKVHGAVDGVAGEYRWKENYVITEDHYIDYLSRSPVESLCPVQILDKLRDSHCLFLGYTMRDWNLRVFLKRIWRGEPLDTKSWAVEPDADLLEKELWAQSHVDLYSVELSEYIEQLTTQLLARTGER